MRTACKTIIRTSQQRIWVKAQIDDSHDTNNSELMHRIASNDANAAPPSKSFGKHYAKAKEVARHIDSTRKSSNSHCRAHTAEYHLTPAAVLGLEGIWTPVRYHY